MRIIGSGETSDMEAVIVAGAWLGLCGVVWVAWVMGSNGVQKRDEELRQ